MKMRVMSVVVVAGGCVMSGMSEPVKETQKPGTATNAPVAGPKVPIAPMTTEQLAQQLEMMAKIDWLVGRWDGNGELVPPTGEKIAQHGEWRVERCLEDRYLRLEFAARMGDNPDDPRRSRWVGIFTFDPRLGKAGMFRTVWFNADSGDSFKEQGELNEAGDTLVVESQKDQRGTDKKLRVRSTFRKHAADHASCTDEEFQEADGTWKKSFFFDLTRKQEG